MLRIAGTGLRRRRVPCQSRPGSMTCRSPP